MTDCNCHQCRHDRAKTSKPEDPVGWWMLNQMFVTCPDCGNKRCPKATNHRRPCTNKNEPGQKGSIYGDYEI
jgi:hypothetical protein